MKSKKINRWILHCTLKYSNGIWMTVDQVPLFLRFSECHMSLWLWETNGVHLSVLLKGWFITSSFSSTCPGTELFCNATRQHFLECWGSDDSPSILFIATLPLNNVAGYVMFSACSLSFFSTARMLAECRLLYQLYVSAPFSVLPGEISLSNLSFCIFFLVK